MRRTPERLRARLSLLRRELAGSLAEAERVRREATGRADMALSERAEADEVAITALRAAVRRAAVCLSIIYQHDPMVGKTTPGGIRGFAWACLPAEVGGDTWDGEDMRRQGFERLQAQTAREPGVSPDDAMEAYRAVWVDPTVLQLSDGTRLRELAVLSLALQDHLCLIRTLAAIGDAPPAETDPEAA